MSDRNCAPSRTVHCAGGAKGDFIHNQFKLVTRLWHRVTLFVKGWMGKYWLWAPHLIPKLRGKQFNVLTLWENLYFYLYLLLKFCHVYLIIRHWIELECWQDYFIIQVHKWVIGTLLTAWYILISAFPGNIVLLFLNILLSGHSYQTPCPVANTPLLDFYEFDNRLDKACLTES